MKPYTRGLVSCDDHILEPPDLFKTFAPAAMQDRMPLWGKQGDHVGWTFGKTFYGISKAATAAGQPWGKAGIFVPCEEIPPGLDSPFERLAAMTRDGVAMSLCFPSTMGLGGETATREFLSGAITKTEAEETLRAYNRFVFEWWCAADKRRFIPACAVPLWGGKEASWWVNDLAMRGAKAILFPQAPQQIGLPPVWHPHWAPMFRRMEETGLVLVTHIFSDDMKTYMESGLPPYLPLTLGRTSAIETIAAWILTPALDRHPKLKIMVAESGVGWIPWFLQLANESARLHAFEFGRMKMLPMERFEQHFGLSILGSEAVAPETVASLPAGTLDRLFFETDYPHLDGSYPHSVAAFAGLGIPDGFHDKVARENAIEFFELKDPYELPIRLDCPDLTYCSECGWGLSAANGIVAHADGCSRAQS